MKPIPELLKQEGDGLALVIVPETPRLPSPPAGTNPSAPVGFRQVQQDEVVVRGDFVTGVHQGVEPWEGPGGFRASSFVKTIYRRISPESTG